MTLGHPGIGLPAPLFESFVDTLQHVSGNIWQCKDKYGYFCTAPVSCYTFTGGVGSSYNLTNYDFRIVYETDTGNYLRVPLLSLMRNS